MKIMRTEMWKKYANNVKIMKMQAWAQKMGLAQKLAQGRPGTRARANFWARAWAQAQFLGPGLALHIIFIFISYFNS